MINLVEGCVKVLVTIPKFRDCDVRGDDAVAGLGKMDKNV
jgi:hypothetical protein